MEHPLIMAPSLSSRYLDDTDYFPQILGSEADQWSVPGNRGKSAGIGRMKGFSFGGEGSCNRAWS